VARTRSGTTRAETYAYQFAPGSPSEVHTLALTATEMVADDSGGQRRRWRYQLRTNGQVVFTGTDFETPPGFTPDRAATDLLDHLAVVPEEASPERLASYSRRQREWASRYAAYLESVAYLASASGVVGLDMATYRVPDQAGQLATLIAQDRVSEDERAHAETGRCLFQTEYGTPYTKFCSRRPAGGSLYCTRHERYLADNYGLQTLLVPRPPATPQSGEEQPPGGTSSSPGSGATPATSASPTGAGEPLTYDQLVAELTAISRDAAAELEDAQISQRRATEDGRRIEAMVASLAALHLDQETVAEIGALADSAATGRRAAVDRAQAAETHHSQADRILVGLRSRHHALVEAYAATPDAGAERGFYQP
jgi:hypothetical protein